MTASQVFGAYLAGLVLGAISSLLASALGPSN